MHETGYLAVQVAMRGHLPRQDAHRATFLGVETLPRHLGRLGLGERN
jgi:hypothetical protein